jgi:hypothetical protein
MARSEIECFWGSWMLWFLNYILTDTCWCCRIWEEELFEWALPRKGDHHNPTMTITKGVHHNPTMTITKGVEVLIIKVDGLQLYALLTP